MRHGSLVLQSEDDVAAVRQAQHVDGEPGSVDDEPVLRILERRLAVPQAPDLRASAGSRVVDLDPAEPEQYDARPVELEGVDALPELQDGEPRAAPAQQGERAVSLERGDPARVDGRDGAGVGAGTDRHLPAPV